MILQIHSNVIGKEPEIFAGMILDAEGDLSVFYESYVEAFGNIRRPVILADPESEL